MKIAIIPEGQEYAPRLQPAPPIHLADQNHTRYPSRRCTILKKRWLNDGLQACAIRSTRESSEDVTYTWRTKSSCSVLARIFCQLAGEGLGSRGQSPSQGSGGSALTGVRGQCPWKLKMFSLWKCWKLLFLIPFYWFCHWYTAGKAVGIIVRRQPANVCRLINVKSQLAKVWLLLVPTDYRPSQPAFCRYCRFRREHRRMTDLLGVKWQIL